MLTLKWHLVRGVCHFSGGLWLSLSLFYLSLQILLLQQRCKIAMVQRLGHLWKAPQAKLAKSQNEAKTACLYPKIPQNRGTPF
jgi:hypothetical protein